MSHAFQLAARFIAGAAGVLFLYAALFLYEDEQGRLQNKLEEWWVKISDRQSIAVSRYAAFMQEIATLATSALDRLLGEKVVSFRTIQVSIVFSAGSYCLFLFGDGLIKEHEPNLIFLIAGGIFFTLGSLTPTIRKPVRFVLSLFLLAFILLLGIGLAATLGNGTYYSLLGGLVCDLIFIALTRQTLHWCEHMERFSAAVFVILLNFALAAVFLFMPALPLYVRWYDPSGPGAYEKAMLLNQVAVFVAVNTVAGFAASLFVLLALLAIAHRIFWPVLSRAMYAVQGAGIARRRRLMASLGVLFMAHAGIGLPETIKKIIVTLAS
jgi:hypothetical protein